MKAINHGHAPGLVREMFQDAIEAFVSWNSDEPEPKVTYELRYEPREITISQACGILWHCKDILPRGDYDWLSSCEVEPKSQTYAAAAQAMLPAIKAGNGRRPRNETLHRHGVKAGCTLNFTGPG